MKTFLAILTLLVMAAFVPTAHASPDALKYFNKALARADARSPDQWKSSLSGLRAWYEEDYRAYKIFIRDGYSFTIGGTVIANKMQASDQSQIVQILTKAMFAGNIDPDTVKNMKTEPALIRLRISDFAKDIACLVNEPSAIPDIGTSFDCEGVQYVDLLGLNDILLYGF